MDFKDQIKQLAGRVTRLKDNINTEQATKTSLVLPFLQPLGYNVRLVSCIAVWLLCLSCAPKHQFYFTPSSYDQKGQLQDLAFSTHQPQVNLSHEGTLADSVGFTTTAPNAEDLSANAGSQTMPVVARSNVAPVDKAIGSTRQAVRVTKLPIAINEKGVSPSAEKPPVHPLAVLSFIFSIIGLAYGFTGGKFRAIPMLFSFLAAFITGGIAISKIKKEPNRFSGKGLAKATLFIAAVILIVSVVAIIAIRV